MSRRFVAAAGLAIAALALATLLVGIQYRPVTFPPPIAIPAAPAPAFDQFVGADACAACHRTQYTAWTGSTHGKAGGAPSRDRVIAPFNGVPMRFKDALVTPSVTARGTYAFTVVQANHPVRVFAVDAVVGGGFMAGGGTQAYFSRFPDGTLRFLPFDYSKSAGRWFCNTGRVHAGAIPVTPEVALADCGDWTPRRVLGGTDRFPSCQQCHGSQIELGFDVTERRYDTRFTTLAINCESCHGPGRRHVELAQSGRLDAEGGIGMEPLATLTKDQSLQVCFRCHAVKTLVQPGYTAGRPWEEHFALKLPAVLDTLYHPDGRTRTFAYQEGHLSSDCYLSGSMTCVDCHNPHSQRYRDVNYAPLPGRFDDRQCLGCHPSKAEPPGQHAHHPATSAGARCVSCHMPYLQEPEVGRRIPYGRSDHTIPIPRPLDATRLGVENACQQCHREQAVEALQARIAQWYGELKPRAAPVDAAMAGDSMADPRTAAGRILATSGTHGVAEFLGLTDVLQRYAGPDAPEFDRTTIESLKRRAASPDQEVRALSLATLHLARGADSRVRRFLARQLRTLGTEDGGIRLRWAWILTARGDQYLNGGDYRNAVIAYQRANEVSPARSALRGIGVAYTRLGEYDQAVNYLRQSLDLDPGQAPVWVELGLALTRRGDIDGATAAYRGAIAINPWDPIGYASLGVALLERGEVQRSIENLERAVSLDPSRADVHFVLANAYATAGRLPKAAEALQLGLEFDPRNARARQMLDEVRRRAAADAR